MEWFKHKRATEKQIKFDLIVDKLGFWLCYIFFITTLLVVILFFKFWGLLIAGFILMPMMLSMHYLSRRLNELTLELREWRNQNK